MSIKYLALRLRGWLQSWGTHGTQYNRDTGFFPTKSAIAGLCASALGIGRGSPGEPGFLEQFNRLKMDVLRKRKPHPRWEGETIDINLLSDYHTVRDTKKAGGGSKDCHPYTCFFLTDADFGVILEGEEDFLNRVGDALRDPKWILYFGRKCCLPSGPVYQGVYTTREEAEREFTEAGAGIMTQRDTEEFTEGNDNIFDVPLSFARADRRYAKRRVYTGPYK
ncbi:MAG: type I-E CRISPR-associated protein Cas5/CasD [Brevinematales bacterium]|nr:type I-E CRISPR-associated protein Cas5/CasD [Brevinematales bacterium]